ncbi:hypothetical protein Pcinc_030823 [Petrolisthes cinctipes]|uniref:Uncharacterized protein n=1 Tax=Petrolisthes cinctipes TaxID=88211 RepID=A0AAE1EXJ8_PETCI|nr:hypothetical protein Pcinc_030823 [Petrolisthes cinctipes]
MFLNIAQAPILNEAAARLTELERLLDEHDQIIRELKRSESDSGCINYAGVSSAPSSSTHLNNMLPITITPPTTSRTAPTSPLCSQPRGASTNPNSWKVDSEDTD